MIYRLNNKLYINLNFAFKNLKIINIRKQYILNQKYLNEINYFKENRLIWINSKYTHIKYLNVRKYLRTFLKKDYIE